MASPSNRCSGRFHCGAIVLSQPRLQLFFLFSSLPLKGGPTALHCAHRTSTIPFYMIPPSSLVTLSQVWHPCWSHCGRPLHPYLFLKGSLVDPRLRASNEHLLSVRVPRAGGRPGYPSYPPCPADLNIRAIHIPCIIGEQISYGSHGIVYISDVSGWDAFCHAGEFFRRRTA